MTEDYIPALRQPHEAPHFALHLHAKSFNKSGAAGGTVLEIGSGPPASRSSPSSGSRFIPTDD